MLATADLVKGTPIGIDATTLEANAALRSIVRRDSGETYQEFLTRLAQASGIETPTRADLARWDRTRPKKGRNTDWRHPHDPDARITKMKDGRTHLAHKAEHAVDVETGAIVGVWCNKAAEVGESAKPGRCEWRLPQEPQGMPDALRFLILTAAGWVNRHQEAVIDSLREEHRVLREQRGPRPLRLTDAQRRRLAVRGQKLGRRMPAQVASIVTPDTMLRWYRRLIAWKYDGSAHRRRGRPMTPRAVAELVVRMAGENPTWGYTRIRGALANLGHDIARNTVKRILHDHGIEPDPERARRTPWKAFLQAHWDGLAACDLVTVEGLTLAGLTRYLVFFVIELKTRRVHIAGIHPQPDGQWMEQMARNLTDPVDGFLRTARQLIHDRDPLYTRVFGEILVSGDVEPIRLPPKSPNLNAYAERFVRSIKEECLHRVVPLGEGHLRLIVHEYVEHYHRERNHQGLDNQLLQRPPPPVRSDADVQRRERLGGLLSFYYREAA